VPALRTGVLALVVVATLVAAWWWRRPRPAPPPPSAPHDSTVARIYRQGRALLDAQRATEALPYLEQAVRWRPDLWQLHHSYAVAMMNDLYASRVRLGLEGPATRSSFERVRLARQALVHLGRAESLATAPRDIARARRLAAQVAGAWGFPWDGFIGYRSARLADPAWDEPAILGDHLMLIMRDPTRPDPAAGGVAGLDEPPRP
jgi:hypothetical protein